MAVLNITKKSDNFCVKNDFVDRFMCDANGSFVKVYLYCLRLAYAESPMSISKIASVLNMIQSDVISALKELGYNTFEKIVPGGYAYIKYPVDY